MLFTDEFTLITRSKTSDASKYFSNIPYTKYGGIGATFRISPFVSNAFRAKSRHEYPDPL